MKRLQYDLSRGLVVLFGAGSIVWTASSWSALNAEALFTSVAESIFRDEKFAATQMDVFRLEAEAAREEKWLAPAALDGIAAIRLRIADDDLKAGSREAASSSLADLGRATASAISINPNSSFLWLASYWAQGPSTRTAEQSLKLLSMSYITSPNDGWIAVNRNRLGLSILSALPHPLDDHVLTEFIDLVRSGAYSDVSSIAAGLEPSVREKVSARLTNEREVFEAMKASRPRFSRGTRPSADGPLDVFPK